MEPKDVEGAAAVPEFQHAIAVGEKEFGSRDLARKWLAVNLTFELRVVCDKRQPGPCKHSSRLEETSKAKVMSVMTDRNGTAYFTDVEPGTYVIPTYSQPKWEPRYILELRIKVKPGDTGHREAVPDLKLGKQREEHKCVAVEKAAARSARRRAVTRSPV